MESDGRKMYGLALKLCRNQAEAEDLDLACDRLVPFAHWITPTFMPKRFDTHFFLVAAPPDHVAVHDGSVGFVQRGEDVQRLGDDLEDRSLVEGASREQLAQRLTADDLEHRGLVADRTDLVVMVEPVLELRVQRFEGGSIRLTEDERSEAGLPPRDRESADPRQFLRDARARVR